MPSSKYLSVKIRDDLYWRAHIIQTAAKGSRSIGFLRRNLSGCQKEAKAQAYTTQVRPVLEYASSVWDPFTIQQIHQFEMVKHQAARFVQGDYHIRTPNCVTRMLEDLGCESLEARWGNYVLPYYESPGRITTTPFIDSFKAAMTQHVIPGLFSQIQTYMF